MSKLLTSVRWDPLRVGALLFGAAWVQACAGPAIPARLPQMEERSAQVDPGVPGGSRVLERNDPETGALLRRWHLSWGSDGVRSLDGSDEGWWPDGTRRHARGWTLGEEAGEWRSWHANGVLRSWAEFGQDSGTMRFWHPNGVLATEGLHQGGTRVGTWTYWHENGVRRSEGAFAESRREGTWTFWSVAGEIEAAGLYSAGARVGDWFLAPRESEGAGHGS
jgi:hypothetical protein